MVKLNKIYTRTGDDGTTGLVSGTRIAKDSIRITAIGSVDETNSAIGLARKNLPSAEVQLNDWLGQIQNDLFDLGADLASPAEEMSTEFPALRVTKGQVEWLELAIDMMNEEIPPLKSFVLPAGEAAELHLARSICRRAERDMVTLASGTQQSLSEPALQYINRLSDFLFVATRHVNLKGQGEVLWTPGGNQTQTSDD